MANAQLAGSGAGSRAGEAYSCACVKNCACTDVVCNCLRKSDQTPIGTDSGGYFKTATFGTKTAPASAGRCGCSCGGVLGYKR